MLLVRRKENYFCLYSGFSLTFFLSSVFFRRMPAFRYFARIRGGGLVHGCPVCYTPMCFSQDVQMIDDTYIVVSTLRAINIARVEAEEAFCVCGRYIGQLDGDTFFFHQPVRLNVAATAEDLPNGVERDWHYVPNDFRSPIWGCICCRRVIGTGFEFLHHYCLPVSLVNVVEGTDRRRIQCVCGCYIGYRHRSCILLGDFVQLNSAVTGSAFTL